VFLFSCGFFLTAAPSFLTDPVPSLSLFFEPALRVSFCFIWPHWPLLNFERPPTFPLIVGCAGLSPFFKIRRPVVCPSQPFRCRGRFTLVSLLLFYDFFCVPPAKKCKTVAFREPCALLGFLPWLGPRSCQSAVFLPSARFSSPIVVFNFPNTVRTFSRTVLPKNLFSVTSAKAFLLVWFDGECFLLMFTLVPPSRKRRFFIFPAVAQSTDSRSSHRVLTLLLIFCVLHISVSLHHMTPGLSALPLWMVALQHAW